MTIDRNAEEFQQQFNVVHATIPYIEVHERRARTITELAEEQTRIHWNIVQRVREIQATKLCV